MPRRRIVFTANPGQPRHDQRCLASPASRRGVQQRVDRRFNRARYDADQTVAAFAARLKDAVDLDAVREDLTRVIQVALEPAHVSVWTSPRETDQPRDSSAEPASYG